MSTHQGTAKYIDGHWYLPVEDYHELRDALSAAVHHVENLNRVWAGQRVRDLDESLHGFKNARDLLNRLDGIAGRS